MGKQEEYLKISEEIVKCAGGMENIQGSAHCATRLRIVLKDNDKADMEQLENVSRVKGAFVAGNQLQLIFGAGVVNEVYEVFARYTHTENMSLGDLKAESAKKQNPVQAVIKALSDVFIGIMPALLAAALLMGLTGVLGGLDIVRENETMYAINKLVSLASNGIFAILPMAVCYSAVKRFGGNPVLGMVVGAIMLDGSLANAYQAAQGLADPEVISLFGLKVELVGFQGGIIIALMMGYIVARLDIFFNKKIPDVIKLLVAPLLTVFISTVLLFTCIGPVGRILSDAITNALVWGTNHLGAFGYALFAGVQQLVVITGLHHIIGAVEAQLIADTGTNFINPLMSVALMGQGGAVLGYLAVNWKNVKTRELCIPSFLSTLFGISEPAIFGVNLRYRYPLIGGCIGGAAAGAYVYFSRLTAFGFGTTAVPGIAIANPANNGYVNYIIAHLIALLIGGLVTICFGKMAGKKQPVSKESKSAASEAQIFLKAPVRGEVLPITESSDPTFAQKMLGDGIMVKPQEAKAEVLAPCDGTVKFVYPGGHAVGIETENGLGILIHCGVDTVKLEGEGFTVCTKEGSVVRAGERLLLFDKELIEGRGYSAEVAMLVTDRPENCTVKVEGLAENL
ncbi:MAG: glucose PTS transporter subunit IIA [Lachnospiraceae bacterium]|uniref:PTS beta-glucoside transporter subunit IIBCA n=1 Tax=Parablautia sp. Marseille-Q6255 TaxID=3039593 RepID=UPI0024BBFA29|nr:glucose PTS transporter subunit IIA [Parablautia sp. Marseille-Q6255]